ncbi:MAG: XdhC/CoxI family protein [Deltaproteobacteria bacterium]
MEPFDAIIDYLAQGKPGALATIVSRVGATPRDAGAKVFIGEDGKIYGTIGGGCMEAEVWQHAKTVIASGEAKSLRYSLNGRTVEDEGMICGGTAEIFLEPVTLKQKELYNRLMQCISNGERVIMATKADGPPFEKILIPRHGAATGDILPPVLEKNIDGYFRSKGPFVQDGYMIEVIAPPPHLYIYGAGHISQYISTMAKLVDFHITVIDDRSQFANRDRFPDADEIIVEEFKNVFEKVHPPLSGYAVIVTRGHKHDAVVLEEVLKQPQQYVGMIGSKRKVKIIYDDLIKKGVGKNLLRIVHAPIGIDIDAETPQEIAVSIVAELIKARSNRL